MAGRRLITKFLLLAFLACLIMISLRLKPLPIHTEPGKNFKDDDSIWERLDRRLEAKIGEEKAGAAAPRVLCWVMTHPKNHPNKAKAVQETWGPRCDVLLFMSTKLGTLVALCFFGYIMLDIPDGRNYLTPKTGAAFEYVYHHHFHEADWFMKADDDTFVIVDNLRYVLSDYDTNKPYYFGARFKPFVKQGYMSGGAGYVLSKEALHRMIVHGVHNTSMKECRFNKGPPEDMIVGKCLQAVGVPAMDSRDPHGRHRFFCFTPGFYTEPRNVSGSTFWFWKYNYHNISIGKDCCSSTAISFHYVASKDMYKYDYLINYLRPHRMSEKKAEWAP